MNARRWRELGERMLGDLIARFLNSQCLTSPSCTPVAPLLFSHPCLVQDGYSYVGSPSSPVYACRPKASQPLVGLAQRLQPAADPNHQPDPAPPSVLAPCERIHPAAAATTAAAAGHVHDRGTDAELKQDACAATTPTPPSPAPYASYGFANPST